MISSLIGKAGGGISNALGFAKKGFGGFGGPATAIFSNFMGGNTGQALVNAGLGLSTGKEQRKMFDEQMKFQERWNTRGEDFAREQYGTSKQQFADQMDNLIQRKVKDAQAAGLHPLFALGASSPGGTSSPAFIPGQSPQGSFSDDGVLRVMEMIASKMGGPSAMERAQIRSLNASAARNEALAQEIHSTIKTTGQPGSVQQAELPDIVKEPIRMPPKTPEDPSIAKGKVPFFQKVVIGKDKHGREKTIDAPRADNPAEMFENLGAVVMTVMKALGWLDEEPIEETNRKRKNSALGQRRGLK